MEHRIVSLRLAVRLSQAGGLRSKMSRASLSLLIFISFMHERESAFYMALILAEENIFCKFAHNSQKCAEI